MCSGLLTVLAGKQSVGFSSSLPGSTHSHAASINGNECADILLFGGEALSHHLPSKQGKQYTGLPLFWALKMAPQAQWLK